MDANYQAFWEDLVHKSMVARYTTVASFIWLLWDWISTLDEEISYIWTKKRSFSKYLYFLTRYFGLFFLAFEMLSETRGWVLDYCLSYYYVIAISTTLILYIVEIGMQFRVYALYNCSKKILIVNGTLFGLEVIAVSTMIGLDLATRTKPMRLPTLAMENAPLTGCWNSERPHFTFANWIIALCYELYLFALIAYKAYGKYSQFGTFAGIFKLMFRDAIIWFVFIAGLIGWNAFSWLSGTNGYVFLGLPFMHAGAVIGGSRLLLNLGRAYYVTKDESWVCAGAGSATHGLPYPSYPKQTLEMKSLGSNSACSVPALPRPPKRKPAPAMGVRGGNISPITSAGVYPFPGQGNGKVSSRKQASHTNHSHSHSKENALQIDLGFGCARASSGSPERRASTYYSYAEAWADHIPGLWDEDDDDDYSKSSYYEVTPSNEFAAP